MNAILGAVLILAILFGLGYYAWETDNPNVKPILQKYIPSGIQQTFSTGDVMTLNLQPMTNVKTIDSGILNEPNTIVTSNAINNSTGKPIKVNVTNPSILNTTAMQSYGQTNSNKEILPTGTFQLGNPIQISGNIQMVVPDSCINLGGKVTCQYVDPPLWHYLITITCKINENNNCAMDDRSTYGVTDGSGNYNYTWIPDSGSLNPGYYLVMIQASSQTKDPNGIAYTLTQQEMVNLVR